MISSTNNQSGPILSLDDTEGKVQHVLVESKTGKTWSVEVPNLKICSFFYNAYQMIGNTDSGTINCPQGTDNQIDNIVKYLEARRGVDDDVKELPKPLPMSKVFEDLLDPIDRKWLSEFLVSESSTEVPSRDEEVNALLEMIKFVNYLNIKCLVNMMAAKIASYIKGKPKEEIRVILGAQPEEHKEPDQ